MKVLRRLPLTVYFTLFLLVVFVAAFISVWNWPVGARLMPLAVCIPAILLLLVQLVRDMTVQDDADSRNMTIDLALDFDVDRMAMRRGVLFGASLIGMLVLIKLVGFFLASVLFIVFWMKRMGEKTVLTVGLSSGVLLFLLLVFDSVIRVPWPEPFLVSPQELVRDTVHTFTAWIGSLFG